MSTVSRTLHIGGPFADVADAADVTSVFPDAVVCARAASIIE